jgi:hypothetical protein
MRQVVAMEVLLERCAGLDVHQASVVCCVLIGAPGRRPQKLLRRFGTTVRELEALRADLSGLAPTGACGASCASARNGPPAASAW